MSGFQAYQLWIGFGFALLLVIFLIVAFFKKGELTHAQWAILRFLSSLCAAFAGALITGDALFKLDGTMGPNTKYAISGTAGFALFFVVWFFFPKPPSKPQFKDGFHFSVPNGWTFRQVVEAIVQLDSAVAEYDGFKPEELNTALGARELHADTVKDAIGALRSIAPQDAIRKYSVDYSRPTYRLTIAT